MDWVLIFMVMGVCLFGILAVTVATFSSSSDPEASLLTHIAESTSARRQCLYVLLAPFIFGIICSVPYDIFKNYGRFLYMASVALVTVVFVINRATGVKQWLDVILDFTIQPSEFVKLTLILLLARELGRETAPMSTFRGAVRILVYIGIPAVVNLLSGETGTTIVLIFLSAVMMFFSGVPWKTLGILVAMAVGLILGVYGFAVASGSDDYRLMRILAFFNPSEYSGDAAYQQLRSMMAIGSGGMNGVGLFTPGALYQLNYVPADWTDFIFATVGEAFGFYVCLGLLLLYFAIIMKLFFLAIHTTDRFGMLVIIGVMGMLLFHVFENIGMTIGAVPITGIPLPFVSYGGSNMVTNLGGIALVLNVTKNRSLAGSGGGAPQPSFSQVPYGGRFRRFPNGRGQS